MSPAIRGAGPTDDDYGELDEPESPRPYGSRPYGSRPYGSRPYGSRPYGSRPYGSRPYGSRPYGSRPYGSRPYGSRPYGSRPYGSRDDDGDGDGPGGLDPAEWSADVADLFCDCSAVVRLGARVVVSGDEIRVPRLRFLAGSGARYLPRPAKGQPLGPTIEPEVLQPSAHELLVTLAIPNRLVSDLAEDPDLAAAVKQDLANELALGADSAFLRGQKPGLVGIEYDPAIPVAPGADPKDLLATAREMVADLRARPALFRNPGWVLSTGAIVKLSALRTETSLVAVDQDVRSLDSGRLLSYDGADGGDLLGFRYIVTPAAGGAKEEHAFLSSDWSEAWIGVDRDLVTVDLSTQIRFTTDQTIVRAVMRHDFRVRRPDYFTRV
jgi:HK97 family phage major capsid protein